MIAKPTGINTLIAEHVFGWKWDKHWAGGCWIIPERYRDWYSGEPHVSPPNFTEDISDAWQVVEKLSGDGDEHPACIQKGLPAFGDHATPFEVYKNYAGYPGWTCYFADYEVCAHADTAPLAICLAALKACGVEVESPK